MFKRTHGTYLVKVADFGFSAVKRKSEEYLQVGSSFKGGTPHTVAPEILRRHGFNQKAGAYFVCMFWCVRVCVCVCVFNILYLDVYSFAMVLWGIYTCQPLYPHHKYLPLLNYYPTRSLTPSLPPTTTQISDFRKFRAAILAGERPEIPQNCPAEIRNLLEECWQEDPNKRFVSI